MAGTRRSSQVDVDLLHTSTHRHQRAASNATSTVEESAAGAEVSKSIEIAESADEADSPNPDEPPVNRSTKGYCKNCGSNIGEYFNSWHKITGSYYVPALLGSYRSLLRHSGKQKAASKGTAIEGCMIQPLSCPTLGCTDNSPIGFTVVDAPAGKAKFRGRDFFKLNRIELRCEAAGNKTIIVEPQEDPALKLLVAEDSNSPSPVAERVPPTESMEFESRQPPARAPGPDHHQHQHEQPQQHPYQHQPLQQSEARRQSLPPPSTVRSPIALAPSHPIPPQTPSNPLPSVSPTVKPVHEVLHAAQLSSGKSPSGGLANTRFDRPQSSDFPPGASQLPSPIEQQYVNEQPYPRSPKDVSLDAIERIQTQVTQNTGALAVHTRDIRLGEESFRQLEATIRKEVAAQTQRQVADMQRVGEDVGRLHMELHGVRQAIEGLARELAITRAEQQSGATVQAGRGASAQDSAIELLAEQVELTSQKANEVDALKLRFEILKNKVHRLEEGGTLAPVPQPQPMLRAYQSPLQPGVQSLHSAPAPTFRATPVGASHDITPSQLQPTSQTPQSTGGPSSTGPPDIVHQPEPAPSQGSGWATINGGTKRPLSNSAEPSQEASNNALGSPKRQRVAAIDPHAIYTESQNPSQPVGHPPFESPFSTQHGPSDDSWRPESQRFIGPRPRGRPRGSGSGSRGGRVRKSMAPQVRQLGTPEWEKDDWQGVTESQTGPDGYYNHLVHSGRGIARRGNGGGGGRGGYMHSDRAMSLGSQGISPGMEFGTLSDHYQFTKKTRSKPIRNADGVLIRKDGRPDMRSQSSAANLRKVHARKEGELSQGSPPGFTHTNMRDANPHEAPDTPSPSGYAHPDQDQHAPTSAQKKHNAIISKMFPKGISRSRMEHDYARQLFEQDDDHTARPHTQNLQYTEATKAAIQIKKEEYERSRLSISQSPNDGDEDMDCVEAPHADDQEQTPGEQSDDYHDAQTQEQSQEDAAQIVPETQAIGSSSSQAADSTQVF